MKTIQYIPQANTEGISDNKKTRETAPLWSSADKLSTESSPALPSRDPSVANTFISTDDAHQAP